MNYYNEFDPFAAKWLRELIAEKLIPEGDVDDRSIVDVRPGDLAGYTQCHFFTGIGGWPRALEIAGVPANRPLWTGSPPCQPFSVAGKGKGAADERHLWPVFFDLIRQCRPPSLLGEQVDAAIAHGWLDLVQTDLEGEGYAFGAVGLPAASVGAPHLRHRLFFVAHSDRSGRGSGGRDWVRRKGEARHEFGQCGLDDRLGLAHRERRQGLGVLPGQQDGPAHPETAGDGADGRLGDTEMLGRERRPGHDGIWLAESPGREQRVGGGSSPDYWSDAIYIPCRDGKYRPIPAQAESVFQRMVDGVPPGLDGCGPESGFPLAWGQIEGRAGILKGYGNAIVPEVAAVFIQAAMPTMNPSCLTCQHWLDANRGQHLCDLDRKWHQEPCEGYVREPGSDDEERLNNGG